MYHLSILRGSLTNIISSFPTTLSYRSLLLSRIFIPSHTFSFPPYSLIPYTPSLIVLVTFYSLAFSFHLILSHSLHTISFPTHPLSPFYSPWSFPLFITLNCPALARRSTLPAFDLIFVVPFFLLCQILFVVANCFIVNF